MEVCKLSSKAIKKINPLISTLGTMEVAAAPRPALFLASEQLPPIRNGSVFLHFQKGNQEKVSPLEPPFKITYFRQTARK